MEIKCIKSAARLLDRDSVNRRGLDLSKEVLWVSVYQRAADLPAVKVGGLNWVRTRRNIFQPGIFEIVLF